MGRELLSPTQCIIDPYHPFFMGQMMKRAGALFGGDPDEKTKDIIEILYIHMKRLKQSYETIMTMDPDLRDTLYDIEMSLIKQEKTNATGKVSV